MEMIIYIYIHSIHIQKKENNPQSHILLIVNIYMQVNPLLEPKPNQTKHT